MMIARQRKWLLILVAWVVNGCATFDAPTPSKQPLTGLIATPVSYYSTPKAKFLASKYKDNLDHITERIVRNSATSQLQFANNISSIGGIGFFTHSAAKTADERYLEVVLGTPETFETKGDYSEKVNRLFALYGRDLLATLAGDSQIFADQDVAGYGLNLTWRTAQSGTQTNRILMARAILYFRKERVASFLQRQLSPQELLGDAVIFALEEGGALNLVSFQPRETQPDFRPPIREDNLASGGSPMITGSGLIQAPVTEKADRSQEKEGAPAAVPVTQEPIEIAAAQENAVAESASKVDTPAAAAAVTAGIEISSGPLEKSSGTEAGSVEERPPAAEKKPAASDTPRRTAAPSVISLSEATTENTPAEANPRGSAATRIPVDSAQPLVSAPKSAPEQSLPSSKPAEVAQAEPKTAATEPGAEVKAPIERVTDMAAPTVDKKTRSDASTSRAQSGKPTQSHAAPAQALASGRKLERAGELSATSSDAQRETAQPAVSTASSTVAARATTAAATAEIKPPDPLMNRPEEQKISRQENTKAPALRPESQPSIRSKAEEFPAAKSSEKIPSIDAAPSGNARNNKSGNAAGRSETPVEIARAETARAIPAAPQTAPAPQVSAPARPSEASKEAIKVPAATALSAAPAKSPESVKPPATDTAAAADTISRSASKPADAATPAPAHEARAVAPVPDQLALLRKPPAPAAVEKPQTMRPAPKSLEGYIIQIAFADKDKAQSWAEKMAQRGYAISVTEAGEAGALRVRLGNFTLRDDAERQLRSFRQEGLSGIIINLPQAFRPEVRSSVP